MSDPSTFSVVKADHYIGFSESGSLPAHTGRTFYVHKNGAGPTNFQVVDTTIEAAVNKCRANKGDVIVVLEGHTESIASATALVLDKAGVTIVGLGSGASRPTLTFTTATTATIPVSAADVVVKNMIFTASFADIVSVFTLTTANNFQLEGSLVNASAADVNFLSVVDTSTVDNDADGLTLLGNEWVEPDLATLYMVNGDADVDRAKVVGNYVNLGVNTSDEPALIGMATGKDLTNLVLTDNTVVRLNDANPLLVVTDTTTANTGVVARNVVRHADTAAELLVTAATNFGFFENYATAAADASGYILPAIDS